MRRSDAGSLAGRRFSRVEVSYLRQLRPVLCLGNLDQAGPGAQQKTTVDGGRGVDAVFHRDFVPRQDNWLRAGLHHGRDARLTEEVQPVARGDGRRPRRSAGTMRPQLPACLQIETEDDSDGIRQVDPAVVRQRRAVVVGGALRRPELLLRSADSDREGFSTIHGRYDDDPPAVCQRRDRGRLRPLGGMAPELFAGGGIERGCSAGPADQRDPPVRSVDGQRSVPTAFGRHLSLP